MAGVTHKKIKSGDNGRAILKLYCGSDAPEKIILRILKIYYENSNAKKYM